MIEVLNQSVNYEETDANFVQALTYNKSHFCE